MRTIETAPEGMLRAWADAGVISSARYVEEMERRRRAYETRTLTLPTGETMELFGQRKSIQAPPLDYALEQELAADLDIPDLDRIEALFDDGVPAGPMPLAVRVVLAIAVVMGAVALWRIWP
ncbi:hypothetical protein EN875_032310 [Mesorhizobium sp. M2D.F.Ca.ET.232.01.1.1]|uniref:hypothetical protein n=1 Tax=Mesorhizobium sp. M2D.F.Ca.ET.232.01.1.1 TaxID=2496670 RepID=UPI000FCBEDC0|nr:hypothetical protein [Mesorhizobium sp. M2D.F.Ca.ET.232.01.1.1]TGP28242.1 hypothetical protein EN875_032310 [Mesorhizobium sp. M2D.F.Ca.ET.232.01.1.1]